MINLLHHQILEVRSRRMSILASLYVLLISLSGCETGKYLPGSNHNIVYWSADATLSIVDKKLVRSGFDIWNKHLNRNIFIEVPSKYAVWTVHRANEQKIANWNIVMAETVVQTHTIIIYDEFDTRTWIGRLNVVLHEAGHVLGFDHAKREGCIMSPIHHSYPGDVYLSSWCDPIIRN